VIASPAQILTTLVSFNQTNGRGPMAPVIQGIDGKLYGVTENGGAENYTDSGFIFN
jgi:hypothetical protein